MLTNVIVRNDLIRDDLIRRLGFDRIDWRWRICTVRILIVADGTINFGTGGFGLSELITKALNTSGTPFVGLNITKAHRGSGAGADITNFRFDATTTAPTNRPFSIDNYDQVWLFGFQGAGSALDAPQLAAIARFMNAGGGVFATGDHEDLGLGLCGEVPRVRTMRKWYFRSPIPAGRLQAPPVGGADRLDTHREGPTPGYQFADQSDAVPQVITPRYYASGSATYPHLLLSKTGGAITVLPDHAHEGECVIPTDLSAKVLPGSSEDEYPFLSGSTTTRVVPEVVAVAASSGGAIEGLSGKPKVNPRCFGAIGAYDGHLAGVGRVSVDSTWHHFLNINLNGADSGRTGFYAGGIPTPEYEDIKQYFRNIAIWLSPPRLQRCFNLRIIFTSRFLYPLIEEIRPIPDPRPQDLLRAGALTRQAIAQSFSEAEAVQVGVALLETQFGRGQFDLRAMVDPWAGAAIKTGELSPLLQPNLLLDSALGGAMLTIANLLPNDPYEVGDKFANQDDREFERILKEGTGLGMKALRQTLESSAKTFSEVIRAIA